MWRLLLCTAFVACFGAAFWPNASGANDRGEVVGAWEGESILSVRQFAPPR